MDLPKTTLGNCHVVVFQDFLSKWPMVYPVKDQKALTLVKLLVNEVIPVIGVPESLLSDRGANLLSALMKDVCQLLGIRKINTTAYHPQCDRMVERFNRTLKSMLRKHVASYGTQWDTYLHAVLYAYRNTPHESTGEKPSFLLFGVDCRTPLEASYLPPEPICDVDVGDYRRELMLSLSRSRELATESIQRAQNSYKRQYDKRTRCTHFDIGDWVLIKFPAEESGKLRKLSRPWHGPYKILLVERPTVTATKVYYPQEGQIKVHLQRVQPCPMEFPAGFYWYGTKRKGPGRPPDGWSSF